ncbi:monooxygenase, partial [Actinosynnema sp. NPDC023658]
MSIGIIGAGISGLHLALRLRQLGIDATLYSARTPEDLRGGPPPNLVTRLGSTRTREEVLGVDHWVGAQFENPSMRLSVEVPDGPSFQAALP